jgi:multicomponent Na+:H+ antiporter subunit G
MMAMAVDLLSWILMVAGAGFLLIGGIGVLRLPDVYTRAHAAGITDTLGADLILVGLMLQGGFTLVTVKLALIMIFIFFTSPTSTHALIHTAHADGLKPVLDNSADKTSGGKEDGPS